MFDRRPKDPEPEKVERVDLAAVKAERLAEQLAAEQAAAPPRVMPPAPNPLAGYLGLPHRAGLPPLDLAQEHDPQLVKLLEEASTADGAAVSLQGEWERHQPGAPGFSEVVAQDNAWAAGYIKAGREIPDDDGPLHLWLTEGQHQLFTAAVHARMSATHADVVLRQYGSDAELRDRLDVAADLIQDKIKELLIETRGTKSRRAYDRAGDLCPAWNRAASLYEWSMNPTLAYRRRNPQAWPEALSLEEHQAATEGLGEVRYEIPDRALGVPSTTVTPGSRSERGTTVNWGPEGPPGSRPARGVT